MNSHTLQIRRIAREWRTETLGLDDRALVPAAALLAAADAATGYARILLPPADLLLAGAQAVLDREAQMIWQSAGQPTKAQHFDAAHEFGHLVLHQETCACSVPADLGEVFDEDGMPLAALTRVEGYSARQRREYEANVFAAELLLPATALRATFFERGWNAAAVGREVGVSSAFVRSQFAQVLLTPARPTTVVAAEEQIAAEPTVALLDPSQQKAAEWDGAPYLLGAGPGTGKTRTLVARCVHLAYDRGIAPEAILALTFSRKAADEMRERLLAAEIGTRNAGPWVGTFHAFGLDLLRRYGHKIGLRPGWRLLDGYDAFLLLEENLERLELDELANLNNPTLYLRDILGAISRAKDELCTPDRYLKLANRMQERCGDELKAFREASRAVETAKAYSVYRELLAENNAIDFGDLIYRAVELLWRHKDVAADINRQYAHVLADEYQDVNRGCARLVQLAAAPGGLNLWVVGDHRQSIYRFRGASPANIAAFQHDYPAGIRDELAVNYRSRKPIVDLFYAAAREMATEDRSNAAFDGWRSQRGASPSDLPPITLAAADDEAAQADGIARLINQFKTIGGYKFADQAILCRTHYQAAALAQRLAAVGVPVHYAENLLERSEAKDLFALLQAASNERSSAIGLLRLASRPEFGFSPTEAQTLACLIAASGVSANAALDRDDIVAGFEDHAGVRTLKRILAALADQTDPAVCLERYLFQESEYLRTVLGSDAAEPPTDLASLSRITAIRQIVELARTFQARGQAALPLAVADDEPIADEELASLLDAEPDTAADTTDGRLAFLRYIRRLIAAGERPPLDLGEKLSSFDAVRMITAHAAKGLEFPVVFVPNLSEGKFPPYGRDKFIPEPPGLVAQFPPNQEVTRQTRFDRNRNRSPDPDKQEEECLFFVALSRAREHLVLSRAERYGSGEREDAPSPLLALIDGGLDHLRIPEERWIGNATPPTATESGDAAGDIRAKPLDSIELDHYMRCPRQYYYARRLGLSTTKDVTAGELFHKAMNATMRWMRAQWATGQAPDIALIDAEFDKHFAHDEPIPHESLYHVRATEVLDAAREAWQSEGLRPVDRADKLIARLDNCTIRAVPDLVAYDREGHLVIARHLLGKPQDRDHSDPRLALFRRAADDTAPNLTARIEIRYLSGGQKRVVPRSDKWEPARVKRYDEAARRLQANDFPATPRESGMCAACPYYFACPA